MKQLRDSALMPANTSFPSDAQLDEIKILSESDANAPGGWVIQLIDPNGISFGDLIVLPDSNVEYIFNNPPPDLTATLCLLLDAETVRRNVALLMHELTHSGQYYEMGADAFYAAWVFDEVLNSSNPLEGEATAVEDAFWVHGLQCANASVEFPGVVEWGAPGTTTTIPVAVASSGRASAENALVTFSLPEGLEFVESTAPICTVLSGLQLVRCQTAVPIEPDSTWDFSVTLHVVNDGPKDVSAHVSLLTGLDSSPLRDVYTLPDFALPADIVTDVGVVALEVPEVVDGTLDDAQISATIVSLTPPQDVADVVEGATVPVLLPPGEHSVRWSAADGVSTVVKTQKVSIIHRNITVLENGDVKYAVNFPFPQAYVEAFVRQNGVQNVAGNIVASKVQNADGTFTYSRVVPASQYHFADAISVRFYSYRSGQPGVFSPGPLQNIWMPTYYYGIGIDTTESCNEHIKVLPNGDMKFSATYLQPQSYAEAFVRKGTVQIAAGNIVQNAVRNTSGTFTYSRIVPRSSFSNGDLLTTRFYSYVNGQPGVFVVSRQRISDKMGHRLRDGLFDSRDIQT